MTESILVGSVNPVKFAAQPLKGKCSKKTNKTDRRGRDSTPVRVRVRPTVRTGRSRTYSGMISTDADAKKSDVDFLEVEEKEEEEEEEIPDLVEVASKKVGGWVDEAGSAATHPVCPKTFLSNIPDPHG